MRRYLASLLTAALFSSSVAAVSAADVAACDLLDEPTVSALIGVKTKQFMNRDKQTYNGVQVSTCMFRADRHSVMITLAEYASSAEAVKAYAVALKDAGQAKVVDNTPIQYKVESDGGIGDKAHWYQLAMEQLGVTVVKGARAMSVNFQFSDGMAGPNVATQLKERTRAAVRSAVRRL